jgi:hypothetical protein
VGAASILGPSADAIDGGRIVEALGPIDEFS